MKYLFLLGMLLGQLVGAQEADLIGQWRVGDESTSLSFTFAESSDVTITVQDLNESSVYNGIWYLDETSLYIGLDSGEELFYDVLNLNSSELILLDENSDELYLTRLELAANPLQTLPQSQTQLPTPLASNPLADSAFLTGKWTYHEDADFLTQEETLYFLPDGRYFVVSSSQVPDYEPTRTQEEGLYAVADNELVLTPFCGTQQRFPLIQEANQLTLSGKNEYGEPKSFAYTFEPGSADFVTSEIQSVDAERETNNQAYLARTPLGPARALAIQTPGLPVDPNPTQVTPNAYVFSEGELYTYLSSWSYVFDLYGQLQTITPTDIAFSTPKTLNLNYSKGTYRDSTQWAFLANGRFYSITELYGLATSLEPLSPQTTAFWGNYHVEGNRLIIKEDAGAVSEFLLLDGRRVLSSKEGICYNEVEWATEKLERQTRDLGN